MAVTARLLTLLAALTVVLPCASAQGTEPSPTPPYSIQREEEDYSFLRDRSRRTDFRDPLKYIPPRAGDENWHLTVSGEVRPYYEQYRNQEFSAEPRDANGYYLQRLMFGFDFHFGKRVRPLRERCSRRPIRTSKR